MGKNYSPPPPAIVLALRQRGRCDQSHRAAPPGPGLPVEVRVNTETGVTMIVVPAKTRIPPVPRRKVTP